MTIDNAQVETHPLWPLKTVEVRGLLGSNSTNRLHLDREISIITGENGSGKSTILQAIWCASDGDWGSLQRLPISGVRLEFASGYWFDVALVSEADNETAPVKLLDSEGNFTEIYATDLHEPLDIEQARFLAQRMRRATSDAERGYLRARFDALQADYELRRNRIGREQASEALDQPGERNSSWLDELKARLSVNYIKASRLDGRGGDAVAASPSRQSHAANIRRHAESGGAIDDVIESIQTLIGEGNSRFTQEETRRNREFLGGLVEGLRTANDEPDSPLNQYDKASEMRDQVTRLSRELDELGLVKGVDDDVISFTDRDAPTTLAGVILTYEDQLRRFEILNDERQRLSLLKRFVDERFVGKTLEFGSDFGVRIRLDNDQVIEPSELSSGEQHLLVLGHELLFATQANAIVLIDEPELSLHVRWLQGITEALLDLGRQADLQFIVATHSPSVASQYVERERPLEDTAV